MKLLSECAIIISLLLSHSHATKRSSWRWWWLKRWWYSWMKPRWSLHEECEGIISSSGNNGNRSNGVKNCYKQAKERCVYGSKAVGNSAHFGGNFDKEIMIMDIIESVFKYLHFSLSFSSSSLFLPLPKLMCVRVWVCV